MRSQQNMYVYMHILLQQKSKRQPHFSSNQFESEIDFQFDYEMVFVEFKVIMKCRKKECCGILQWTKDSESFE